MGILRTFFLRHRALALALLAAALAMKALVPAGMMIGETSRHLTIEICADASGAGGHPLRQIAVPMKGHAGELPGSAGQHGDSCPWSALSLVALGGADLAQLVLALAFILALGFAAHRLPAAPRISHLRPPLRGPPVFI